MRGCVAGIETDRVSSPSMDRPTVTRIRFQNFRVLRDAELVLHPLTLIVGANGSGKSTAIDALARVARPENVLWEDVVHASARSRSDAEVSIEVHWGGLSEEWISVGSWVPKGPPLAITLPSSAIAQGSIRKLTAKLRTGARLDLQDRSTTATDLNQRLAGTVPFRLSPEALRRPSGVMQNARLGGDGAGLPAVVDRLREDDPERFGALNAELARILPEFDQVVTQTTGSSQKLVGLRTRQGKHKILAEHLSDGVLLLLALLTVAHDTHQGALVCLEEPDRGLHPRILRELRDALVRLAYPDAQMVHRGQTQVLLTTHNPYLLDLFRDHPEQVVLANRRGLDATFEALADRKDLGEILGNNQLSEVWFSGVLGGVP